MDRRTYLTTMAVTVGSVGFAGCSGMLEEPQYEEGSKEDLLLEVDAFPNDWHRDDEINENFDACFTNEDESIIVLLSVEIEEGIEEAEKSFESSKSGFRDPQEIDIGEEAFWDTQNDEVAFTIFRHSNALGQAVAARQSGMDINPDQSRSQKYAREMYDNWQES